MADDTDYEGNIITQPSQEKPPAANMPDQAPIAIQQAPANPGPTNTAGGLNTSTMNAPNVSGGQASFSDVTKSILDLANAKSAELSAGMQAYKANTAVDQATSKAIGGISTDTLDALSNIQKAQELPGGADGDIAQIFSLFNSKYDVAAQRTRMEMNQVKATQVTNTAAAIKEQNNALPTLLGQVSAGQKVLFDAQTEANKLALGEKQYTLDSLKARIDVARFNLEQTAEQRNQANFAVAKMSTAQKEAYLQKNPNGPISGLVEHSLTEERAAVTSLGIAANNLAKGNREEYNNSMSDAASHLPRDQLAALMAQAQSKGLPYVEIQTAQKGPDGKPLAIQMPYDLAQQGLIKSTQMDQQANEALAADYSAKGNLLPNIQNVTNAAAAFASMDPRATQVLTQMSGVMRNMDMKNPASVRQGIGIINGYNTQMQQIAKDNAAKFSTPEAKAAVEAYGKTGTFDTQGGLAVVADSGGVPGLMNSARYKKMWGMLSNQVATRLAQQHLVPGGAPNNSTDAMSMIAQMMAKGQGGREKISQITSEVLTDPKNSQPLRDAMLGTIQSRSVETVLGQLASDKNADPMWRQLVQNEKSWTNTDNTINFSKLFTAMENATVMNQVNGKPADATDTFLRALRNFSINADQNSAGDPNFTVQDHAAEAALFGQNPTSSTLNDLHFQLRVIGTKARQQMQDRIKQDVTGQTQRTAVMQADPLFEPQPGLGWNDKGKIFKHTGVNLDLVPSATGTGLTAAQVKAAYPNGAY